MQQIIEPYEITKQAEEYLEAISRIIERGMMATPKELAQELAVAPPSVLGMIRRLEEQHLVSYARQLGAMLTERGRFFAERLRRRHRLAERLLTDLLGMPSARAHDVACRFEHVIDDEVETYLLAALDYPTTCPHGNPLDGRDAAREGGWSPLTDLQAKQTGILRCIIDESEPMLDYLATLHLHPGASVTVQDIAPFDGPLTIDVAGERIAISRAVANHLLVEVTEKNGE